MSWFGWAGLRRKVFLDSNLHILDNKAFKVNPSYGPVVSENVSEGLGVVINKEVCFRILFSSTKMLSSIRIQFTDK